MGIVTSIRAWEERNLLAKGLGIPSSLIRATLYGQGLQRIWMKFTSSQQIASNPSKLMKW